jgi:hypothetical protein
MGKGAKAATSDLEQARTELIRAEELLRQRHANTRVVLLKYKEATAQLEHARALALSLQRRLKEESRQNAKLRAEILKRDQTVLKRDETIEELRRQLRQGNSQSVTRPQTPSDEDLRPGVQMRERSEPSHPSVQSFDSMNVSRRVAKRKVREEVQDHVRDALDDMLNFILDGDQARSLDDRLDTAAETYLREIRVAGNSDEVAEAAMGILLDTCVLQEARGQWAAMAWSPSRWFDCPASEGVSRDSEGRQNVGMRSLVAAWCDPGILETDRIPLLLACLQTVERKADEPIMRALLDRCIKEVRPSEDASTVPTLCCAVTVALALCQMSGNRDVGVGLLVDIMRECVSGKAEYTVALAVALEVWPELAEVVGRSALTFPKAETSGRQPVGDLYEMAVLTLRNTFPKTNV